MSCLLQPAQYDHKRNEKHNSHGEKMARPTQDLQLMSMFQRHKLSLIPVVNNRFVFHCYAYQLVVHHRQYRPPCINGNFIITTQV
jgi:hypothetical protein